MRLLVREGLEASQAKQVLQGLTRQDRHAFWPDAVGYDAVDLGHVIGHGQVTDTHVAGLARVQGGRLATFDRGLASGAGDVALLIPM